MSEARYPPPPWHTFGEGWFRPCVVRAGELRVPAPLEIEARLGRTLGLFAYVEYRPPSPLAYHELIWMPCRVHAELAGRRRRGFYVAKMYVDDEASLEAGRTEWALPKELARFERAGDHVRMTAGDVEIELTLGRAGLSARAKSRIVTLQVESGARVVGFRGETRAPVGMGKLEVVRARGLDAGWRGFEHARLAPFAAHLAGFESTMQAAERWG